MAHDKNIDYTKPWEGAYFMPFKNDEKGNRMGIFEPKNDMDKMLYVAN